VISLVLRGDILWTNAGQETLGRKRLTYFIASLFV